MACLSTKSVILPQCPCCGNEEIFTDLNANYLQCNNCDWKATYRFLVIDKPISFYVDRGFPCVDCGVWVDIENIIDGSCLRCYGDSLEASEYEDDDFYY